MQGKTIIIEGEMKPFHGKKTLKEFMIIMKVLQRIIEGIFKIKEKFKHTQEAIKNTKTVIIQKSTKETTKGYSLRYLW